VTSYLGRLPFWLHSLVESPFLTSGQPNSEHFTLLSLSRYTLHTVQESYMTGIDETQTGSYITAKSSAQRLQVRSGRIWHYLRATSVSSAATYD